MIIYNSNNNNNSNDNNDNNDNDTSINDDNNDEHDNDNDNTDNTTTTTTTNNNNDNTNDNSLSFFESAAEGVIARATTGFERFRRQLSALRRTDSCIVEPCISAVCQASVFRCR